MRPYRSRLYAHITATSLLHHCAVPGDLSKKASLAAGLPEASAQMAATPGNSAIAHALSSSRPPRASRVPPGYSVRGRARARARARARVGFGFRLRLGIGFGLEGAARPLEPAEGRRRVVREGRALRRVELALELRQEAAGAARPEEARKLASEACVRISRWCAKSRAKERARCER